MEVPGGWLAAPHTLTSSCRGPPEPGTPAFASGKVYKPWEHWLTESHHLVFLWNYRWDSDDEVAMTMSLGDTWLAGRQDIFCGAAHAGHLLRSCRQTLAVTHAVRHTHRNARQSSAKERYSGKATGKLPWTSEYFVNDSYTRNLRPTRPNPVDAVSPRQTVRSEESAGVGAIWAVRTLGPHSGVVKETGRITESSSHLVIQCNNNTDLTGFYFGFVPITPATQRLVSGRVDTRRQ